MRQVKQVKDIIYGACSPFMARQVGYGASGTICLRVQEAVRESLDFVHDDAGQRAGRVYVLPMGGAMAERMEVRDG